MPPKQQKKEAVFTDQETEELKKQIINLPKDKPKECEGLIRELYKKISEVSKENMREKLQFELKSASSCCLNSDLKKMVEENGLHLEAFDLVRNYLTTKEELAQYFFVHPKGDVENDGLDAVRRRLGPKLEVLGGLSAKRIDVTQDWVTKLVNKAPSFQSLARLSVDDLEKDCNGASRGEREDVNRLVKIAESRSRQIAAAQDVQQLGEKDGSEKTTDKEKLEKAKALMKEAKEKAKEQSDEAKKIVEDNLAEVTKIIHFPPDWNKHTIGLKPEELFEQIDGVIAQQNSEVEVSEAYKSELELLRKASGGRALCGIYNSVHVPPMTAEIPIIVMPSELILTSPNNSQQVRYMKFSKSRAAANYVHAVKSSSTNVGLSVGGYYDVFVGEMSGALAYKSDEEEKMSGKKQISSASVVQYIWIATKTFKIEQEQLKLTGSARKMARAVGGDEKVARLFMQRYGSHYPAGLHTLGGVLFRIVDAESSSTKSTSELTQKAALQLQGQISFGVVGGAFGIGGNITGKHSRSSGEAKGHDEETDDVSYTFTSQAMGPATTNPASFIKLLTNNSTWALIDRGSPNAYLPIWELIRDLGSDFAVAAKTLEETWHKDEEERERKAIQKKVKITYISGISFSVCDGAINGLPENMFNVDTNCKSGGKFIYPIKHLSDHMDEAIAGLAFIKNDDIVPSGYTKISQDLNQGAKGDYNYLCITKLGENKMTDINFISSGEPLNYPTIDGYFRYQNNLNDGTEKYGDYVYLLYKTDTGKPFE